MENRLKLPVGIENFEEIRRNQYYYIDKTKLIEQLFDSLGKVSLFTRPRRFGKTLNMSMVEYFFSVNHSECSKYFETITCKWRATNDWNNHVKRVQKIY